MANLNDDDVAATRIHHADGSPSGAAVVTAPATVWSGLLSQFSSAQVAGLPSDQKDLLLALKSLCAAP